MLTPMLADFPAPTSDGWWIFCVCVAAVLASAYYGVSIWQMLKPSPALHKYVLLEDFNARMDGMSESSKEFRDKMREEQREIGERLAIVETKQDVSKEKLDVIDTKLDRLIEKGSRHE